MAAGRLTPEPFLIQARKIQLEGLVLKGRNKGQAILKGILQVHNTQVLLGCNAIHRKHLIKKNRRRCSVTVLKFNIPGGQAMS